MATRAYAPSSSPCVGLLSYLLAYFVTYILKAVVKLPKWTAGAWLITVKRNSFDLQDLSRNRK